MSSIAICTATDVGDLTAQPGTYGLVLSSSNRATVAIGRRRRLQIEPGYYVYVGSARGPGGLRARLTRHCREQKATHWHVDYLAPHTDPVSVWYRVGPEHAEHQWAAAFGEMDAMTMQPGFGCSDCRCDSHLFHSATLPVVDCFRSAIL